MSSDTNPISCEPCRQKKCKCDRILPICTQCAPSPTRCIYPESGKRGLPQGYITHLENRLASTELALYTVYSQLRAAGGQNTFSVSGPERPLSRVARMEEWERLPLGQSAELEKWWTERRRVDLGREGVGEGEVVGAGDAGEERKGKAEELARRDDAVYF